MIKKVLFLMLFPLLAGVFISCCDCPNTETLHYTNKTVLLRNLDNSGSGPVVATATQVPKEAYGIRVEIGRERTAALRQSLFLPAAYAFTCDCPPPTQLLPRDSVTAIQVITLKDFDSGHPAGSDISALFKGYNPYYFASIPDYLKKWPTVLFSESELAARIDLLLMTAPTLNTIHQFRVRLTLSDGRALEQDTAPIELT